MSRIYNADGRKIADVDRNGAVASIGIEYGRAHDASYYICRIPRYDINGNRIFPRVALTSADKTLSGAKVSTLTFAKREDVIFTINAGLFQMDTAQLTPHGQTIIDGMSVTNLLDRDSFNASVSDAECYPLCVDADGNLSSPYAQGVDTADMIADGVKYAVTGWGQLIENYAAVTEDKFSDLYTYTTKAPIQVIGQYQNGDYMIFTCDGVRGSAENEAGMTYAQTAEILLSKGVKYAYVLDGGGSTETVIGKRQINPIYEGVEGRKVPTVICFDIAVS